MYIVGFSGPPKSGKDSIAQACCDILDRHYPDCEAYKLSLAEPMRWAGMNLLDVETEDADLYSELKSQPQGLFQRPVESHYEYDNLRQFMIAYSENFIKPRYGHDFWARQLMTRTYCFDNPGRSIIFIPDFGFKSEVDYFEVTPGRENVVTVQLTRPDCDFSIDSRSYVGGKHIIPITNTATIEWAAQEIIARLTESMGWSL